jgi:catechol 2,3-dioxygenase-like lactoylglutathione lyase family enzyme
MIGIHHATLLTGDLAASRAFYEGVLGLRPDPNHPQLGFDGVSCRDPDGNALEFVTCTR